jgi:hypothetical protein
MNDEQRNDAYASKNVLYKFADSPCGLVPKPHSSVDNLLFSPVSSFSSRLGIQCTEPCEGAPALSVSPP